MGIVRLMTKDDGTKEPVYVRSDDAEKELFLGDSSRFAEFCNLAEVYSASMHDYLFAYDYRSEYFYITPNALERFALNNNMFTYPLITLERVIYAEDFPTVQQELSEISLGRRRDHNLQYRWIGKDGKPVWISCMGRTLRNENDEPELFVGCINEIGRTAQASNVSGLLREASFRRAIENDPERDGFILRVGIDDFKLLNERLGKAYGDKVLHDMAECILDRLGPGQHVFHYSADEFLILDYRSVDAEQVSRLYHRIRAQVDVLLAANDYEAMYTISGGVVSLTKNGLTTYEDLLKASEFSLNEAKARGKNQVYLFEEKDYAAFVEGHEILTKLRRAVADSFKGYELFYQPLMDNNTGELFAAEALLRFRDDNGNLVSPAATIPILEESGLIIPVGRWIVYTALAMCNEVRKKHPNFHISINVSYVQVLKSAIHDEILCALQDEGMDPGSVVIELTESGALENSIAVQSVWKQLKEGGVGIAIDDFGTGYSNLHNIGDLSPEIVKIDRGFTVRALHNEYERKLLSHIIEMVHSLDLKTVIEGIETKEELDDISLLHPDYIQGYYFSKPCPREEFLAKYCS